MVDDWGINRENSVKMELIERIIYRDDLFPKSDFCGNFISLIIEMQNSVLFFSYKELVYYNSKDEFLKKFMSLDFASLHKQNSRHKWMPLMDSIPKDCGIVEIKEDENTSYFIRLSNDSIIYIYQGMEGYGTLCQYVSLVPPDDKNRSEVVEYMNEDFVDVIYNEKTGVDLIRRPDNNDDSFQELPSKDKLASNYQEYVHEVESVSKPIHSDSMYFFQDRKALKYGIKLSRLIDYFKGRNK